TINPTGSGDINLITDNASGSYINITGLATASGNALCLDGSSNLTLCNGAPFGLQAAYNTGNTITTTTGRNIAFTLYDESGDSGTATSFTLTNQGTSNAFVINDT